MFASTQPRVRLFPLNRLSSAQSGSLTCRWSLPLRSVFHSALLALALGSAAHDATAQATASTKATSASTRAHKDCTILVMGDSLSAAYGLAREQGWVFLMEGKLKQKFPHCTLINASVSGETTAGGKARLPALLNTHKPSHMILELGANDGLRGLPVEAMKDNLTAMVNMARRAQTQTVLVGMQIPPNYGPQYTRRFGNAFGEVAKQHKLPLVPFMLEGFADQPKAFQADGIHPNAAYQVNILNTIWPTVSASLTP